MSSALTQDSLKSSPAKSGSLVRNSPARPFGRPLGLGLYILFLMIPVYWLLNMSFKTNADILSGLSAPTHGRRRRRSCQAFWSSTKIGA